MDPSVKWSTRKVKTWNESCCVHNEHVLLLDSDPTYCGLHSM